MNNEKQSSSADIDRAVEFFRQQLQFTCKIHRCKVVDIPKSVWDITSEATRGMIQSLCQVESANTTR